MQQIDSLVDGARWHLAGSGRARSGESSWPGRPARSWCSRSSASLAGPTAASSAPWPARGPDQRAAALSLPPPSAPGRPADRDVRAPVAMRRYDDCVRRWVGCSGTPRCPETSSQPPTVRDPTTWTILPKHGPNHLGLRYNALPEHQMSLITLDGVPFRPDGLPAPVLPADLLLACNPGGQRRRHCRVWGARPLLVSWHHQLTPHHTLRWPLTSQQHRNEREGGCVAGCCGRSSCRLAA